jgi:hypothetical protein
MFFFALRITATPLCLSLLAQIGYILHIFALRCERLLLLSISDFKVLIFCSK